MTKSIRIGRLALATALLCSSMSVLDTSTPSASAVVADAVQWNQWSNSGPVPSSRYAPSMAYDADAGNTVLFGGQANNGRQDETWLWQGASWAKPLTMNPPPAKRNAAAMAYDALHKKVVLFGGESTGLTELNDTWAWNGSDWTDVTPPAPQVSPSPREFSSMAYDSVAHTILLFGGLTFSGNNPVPVQDTWSFDGTTWTLLAPITRPTARYGMTLVSDPITGHVMMFGGNDGTAGDHFLNDTWIWNGTDWVQQQPASSPSARELPSMAGDTDSKTVVLFGGGDTTNDVQDLWTWNGSNWQQRFSTAVPVARAGAGMSYDAFHHQTVLFGVSNVALPSDTWLLDSSPGAPTAVTAQNHADARSQVSWTAPVSDGGQVIGSYRVTAVDTTAPLRGGQTCLASVTSCQVIHLTNGDTYHFVVAAINAVGTGPTSASSGNIVPSGPPAAPTNVVASSNLDRKSVVSWVAPANHGAAITKYTVTSAPGGRTCVASVTHCTVLGLVNGTAYRFTVKATNVSGTGLASAASNVATPRTVPGAPTITKVVPGFATIALTWNAPTHTGGTPITGYNVYAGTVSGHPSATPLNRTPLHVRSFTWHTRRGVTYYLTVRAINARGLGTPSKQVAAKAT
jgi:hypothetical protein